MSTIKTRYAFGNEESGIYGFTLSGSPEQCVRKCVERWGKRGFTDRRHNGEQVWLVKIELEHSLKITDAQAEALLGEHTPLL